jgi:hypothetical protein
VGGARSHQPGEERPPHREQHDHGARVYADRRLERGEEQRRSIPRPGSSRAGLIQVAPQRYVAIDLARVHGSARAGRT